MAHRILAVVKDPQDQYVIGLHPIVNNVGFVRQAARACFDMIHADSGAWMHRQGFKRVNQAIAIDQRLCWSEGQCRIVGNVEKIVAGVCR